MKKFLFSLVVLIVFTGFAPHPLKLSTCKITPSHTLCEIDLRLFTDDFTEHLEQLSKQKLNFKKAKKNEWNAVTQYLQSHFKLSCQQQNIAYKITAIKTAEFDLVVAISLEFSLPACEEFKLKNSLMTDAFSNQKNVIYLLTSAPKTFETDVNNQDVLITL